ncbi:hypothetical protein [Gulosibacter chungangensis]|uniref:Cell division protein FtsL n=1 Tax=Gulosibacter chungangensis TaxID=979746 RepID=A0A7J5BDM4_9MICO|nr:hypothetical protein [Gulosibacter chungangensis]KAB1643976.1 hypothetical protein F8O05_04025 [Gulosibacter chungangensis]
MSAAPQSVPQRPLRSDGSGGPRLRLVEGLRNATKVSSRGIWIAVAIVIVAFAVQLFLSTIIVEDAYRTSELEQQHLELEREHTAALEKSDAQDSPQYLAEQATELGMVPAGSSVFLDLESQTVVEGDTQVAPRAEVDASLVPNAVLNPADEDEQTEENGESGEKKTESAVPSEFEMHSPSTR